MLAGGLLEDQKKEVQTKECVTDRKGRSLKKKKKEKTMCKCQNN